MSLKKINKILIIGAALVLGTGAASRAWAEGPNVLEKARAAVSGMTNRLSVTGQLRDQEGGAPKPGFYEQDRGMLLKTLRDPFVPQVPAQPPVQSTDKEPVVDRGWQPAPVSPSSPGSADPAETIIERPVITISGIVWNTDRPQAIIDGEVVDIGDRVKGFAVTAIAREGITLTFEETTFFFEP